MILSYLLHNARTFGQLITIYNYVYWYQGQLKSPAIQTHWDGRMVDIMLTTTYNILLQLVSVAVLQWSQRLCRISPVISMYVVRDHNLLKLTYNGCNVRTFYFLCF